MMGCQTPAAVAAVALLLLLANAPPTQAQPDCTELHADSGTEWGQHIAGHNEDLCWKVFAPVGQYAVVTFTSIDLEAGFDFLRVRRAQGQFTSYLGARTVVADRNYVYISFTSDGSVVSGGFTFEYIAVDAPAGYCGDGVTSVIEACDPAETSYCRFDCTTDANIYTGPPVPPTGLCDIYHANTGTEILHEPANSENECWLILPDPGAINPAMRVEVAVGNLEACCDHVWVNSIRYNPNSVLVFGGTEPVEVRFQSDASILAGDVAISFEPVSYEDLGECGDGIQGPTESCDDGGGQRCPGSCQGYASLFCEETGCPTIPREHCNEFEEVESLPAYINYSHGSSERTCWDFLEMVNETSYLQFRFVEVDMESGFDTISIVVNQRVVVQLSQAEDETYTYEHEDDIFLYLYSDLTVNYDGFEVFVDVCNYEGYCEQASSPNTAAIVVAVVASICLVACCLMAAAFFCVSKSNTRTVTDHRTVLNHAPAAAGAARSTLSHSAAATQEGSSSYSDDVSDRPPLPAFSARGSSFSDEKPPPYTEAVTMSRVPTGVQPGGPGAVDSKRGALAGGPVGSPNQSGRRRSRGGMPSRVIGVLRGGESPSGPVVASTGVLLTNSASRSSASSIG